MELKKLESFRKPALNYEKIEVKNPDLLQGFVFPPSVLAPIGTYNLLHEEELKKTDNPKEEVVNSEILHEQLRNRRLTFYEHHAKKEDVIEGYGAKYIDVDDRYHGFGLYSFIITSGTKVRKENGDRRFFEINPEIKTKKEKIYVCFDDEENAYKRIAKKTFEDKLNQVREIKFSSEIEKIIHEYKAFFRSTFLKPAFGQNVGQHFDPVSNYYAFAKTFLNNIEKMEEYYLYYTILGLLNDTEYQFIAEQITELEKHAEKLHDHIENHYEAKLESKVSEIKLTDPSFEIFYKNLHRQFRNMKSRSYHFNVYTGEFHRNIMTFFYDYVPTETYDDNQIESLRKEATRLEIILHNYLNISAIDKMIESGTIKEDGWHYQGLTDLDKPEVLTAKVNEFKTKIKDTMKHIDLKEYPKYEAFLKL